MKLLIFGIGYSARVFSKLFARKNDNIIIGTSRSFANFNKIINSGAKPIIFNGVNTSLEIIEHISTVSHILVSIPPDKDGDPVLKCFSEAITKAKQLKWIGYLSTVGVYGDHKGKWVDETSLCQPSMSRSIKRLKAEKDWYNLANTIGKPLTILRLSGIYGPGRNPFINIKTGKTRRIIKPGQVFNRIHCDDIAQALNIATYEKTNGIFNITDDEPAPPQDVVLYAHKLANLKPPPEVAFDEACLSTMARSFYSENKRVSNKKSKKILGLDYQYPNYRTALAKIWNTDCWY